MKRFLFILAFVSLFVGTHAQNFNYTVSADSVAWNELSSQTILNANNSAWNFTYKIPIGFDFEFCGRTFDSLTIETNGYIVFDRDRNYALTAFSGVGDCVDTSGNHSVLGYELSGTAGNRILKIQFKNCGETATGCKTMSWQVWLRENGNVEFRIGPGTLRSDENGVDMTKQFRLGFLNMNMDTEDCGVLIGDSPLSPETVPVTENEAELPHLDFIPNTGFRFTFTPSN